ncbi:uncharacterized protein Tco025E_01264 [Trypanosoma conorhini]|uniref:Uncharacterized protein n=1 Tax=Trypanosoma conorhini TaxID=83891 RepID=A0A3R7NZQ4_9TRYP|nr:uncharacterized protein Tco025E_01264 [Trypanosoma conorhini]RNF26423.1 hypothetical protein Tco025E_01264 [Trypanosoma conorhini]
MFLELTPEHEASRAAAREAVLAAKAMLAAVTGASLLSREAFITICVEASLEFLRGRWREKSSARNDKSDDDGRRKSRASFSPNTDAKRSNGNKFAHHHQQRQHRQSGRSSGNGNHTAQMRRQRDASVRCREDEHEKQPPQHRRSSPFDEGELRRLRELVEAEYGAFRREGGAGQGEAATAQFTALPPAKLEAAAIIRQALHDPYRRGAISRQQYSVIVLAVMEKLFPDLATATSDDAVPPGGREHSGSGSGLRGETLEEEEEVLVDPPQEPHAALRPDVVELTLQLTQRALQHYLLFDRNGHETEVVVEDAEEAGGASRGRWVANDVSPLPRNPYAPVTPQAGRQHSTPESVSFPAQFDDAFEEQVEKLRQLLEKKYALDLSGTCAGASRRSGPASGGVDARRAPNSASNAATSATAAAVGAGSPSLCGGGCATEGAATAREKREKLLTEALRCQRELYQTHTRLSGIMRELYKAEHPGSDPHRLCVGIATEEE